MRAVFILSFIFLFSGCGSEDKSETPFSLTQFNQDCIDGKISGEYLIKLSDQSFQKVTASSRKHLLRKINTQTFQQNLKSKNLSITKIGFNFKVLAQQDDTENGLEPQASFSEAPHLLNAPFLWNKGFRGQGAVTAVIDSGYDISHVLLKESVQENIFELGSDEDQNGFSNDRFGWDFINNKPLVGDLESHGTNVGSAIAAKHTDRHKFSIAPESKIVPIAALKPSVDGLTAANGDSNSILNSIDYAIKRNVDFINASWGGDICSPFIREKIKEATELGIVFVTAAGNSGLNLDENISFPASLSLPLLVTVGALARSGNIEPNSNFGNAVDFFALGQKTVVASPQNTLGRVTGTSIAAPYITGALALLKSAFPAASGRVLIEALEKSKNTQKTPDLQEAFEFLQER